MKRLNNLLVLLIYLSFVILLFFNCTQKSREHLNPYDPEYLSTSDSSGDSGGGGSNGNGNVGVISFDASSYSGTNATATITLSDADLSATSADVSVKSSSDSTGITLTLSKTGSVYKGTLGFTSGSSVINSKIKVADNDTVTVVYNDAAPSGTRSDTATWVASGGSSTGSSNKIVYDDVAYNYKFFIPLVPTAKTDSAYSADKNSGLYSFRMWDTGTNGSGVANPNYHIEITENNGAGTGLDGPDLTSYTNLTFYAKSLSGSSAKVWVKVINKSGMPVEQNSFDIGTSWAKYSLNFTGAKITNVNLLFYFEVQNSDNPGLNCDILFDDVQFER